MGYEGEVMSGVWKGRVVSGMCEREVVSGVWKGRLVSGKWLWVVSGM